jgi:ribose transport system permease protein
MSEIRAPHDDLPGVEPADRDQRAALADVNTASAADVSSASPSPVAGDVSVAGRRELLGGALRTLGPRRISAVYLWIAFVILFGVLEPDIYLSSVTVQLIFSEGAVTCLLALAFLVPLAAGAYDLSIGAVMSASVAIGAWLQLNTSVPPGAGAIVCVGAGALCGWVSGFVVVRLRVNSFIATLGMSQVLLAVVLLVSGNRQLVAEFPDSWSSLALDKVAGIPLADVYLLLVALALWYVLEHTRIGRYLFATGGNAEAARLSGVRTDRMVWGALAASGAIAGLAGVVYGMRVGTFDATVGPGYLFPAIAAVFLGASQLSQRPNVWGTLIAYFALAFGIQGLALSASSAAVWSQPLFQGIALIVAVAMAGLPAARKSGRWRRLRDRAPAGRPL